MYSFGLSVYTGWWVIPLHNYPFHPGEIVTTETGKQKRGGANSSKNVFGCPGRCCGRCPLLLRHLCFWLLPTPTARWNQSQTLGPISAENLEVSSESYRSPENTLFAHWQQFVLHFDWPLLLWLVPIRNLAHRGAKFSGFDLLGAREGQRFLFGWNIEM